MKLSNLYSEVETKDKYFKSAPEQIQIKTVWGWVKRIVKENIKNYYSLSKSKRKTDKEHPKETINVIKTVKVASYHSFNTIVKFDQLKK